MDSTRAAPPRSATVAAPASAVRPGGESLVQSHGGGDPADEAPEDGSGEGAADPGTTKKPKKSTQRGEARRKIIAALSKHHQYADGGCLNCEPIGNNELARQAEVAESTASAFFEKQFQGHDQYRVLCRKQGDLAAALKLLNGKFSPHILYGRNPPGEGPDDE